MHGVWTLVPGQFSKGILSSLSRDDDRLQITQMEIWSEENHIETLSPNNEHHDLEDAGHDMDSSDNRASEDSESDFEEKIKRLLHTGQVDDPAQSTRRSERQKKPSSRWTEKQGLSHSHPNQLRRKGLLLLPRKKVLPLPLFLLLNGLIFNYRSIALHVEFLLIRCIIGIAVPLIYACLNHNAHPLRGILRVPLG